MPNNLRIESSNRVARVTFERPPLNILDIGMVAEIAEALVRLPASNEFIVFQGADNCFSGGADVADHTPERVGRLLGAFHRVFHEMGAGHAVTIAAVEGHCLGGGCELALACTLRVASRNAKLGQPEVKLGIIPGYGGTQRLARLCGKGVAHELILTGEMITAEEALRVGLVNRVVDSGELLATAEAMARKIIANAPLAVKYAMEAVERGMEMPQEEGLYLEATLFGLACATQDMREGTRAFLEKRPPKFEGR